MDYIGLITQLAGSFAGEAASSMDRAEVMRLIKSVSDEYGKIDIPKLKEVILQKAGPTKLAGIKDDPEYRNQQNQADAQLNDVINSGGQTIADKAALNAIRNKVSRTESAGRHAIESGMAARGTLDSGNSLAMELQGNQQAAQLANESGENAAGLADSRHFEAIRERARNASTGLDRSYRQQSDAARAQDAIDAGNLAIANTTAMHNAGLPQQDFENKLKLAGAKAQPTYALAGAHGAQAQNTQEQWAKVGAIGAAAANKAGGSKSNTGPGADYSGSNSNTPRFDQGTTNTLNDSTGGSFNDYPGSSSEPLSSASTRPARQKVVIGEDEQGNPIYGYPRANP